jgi:hypothetical protein
MALSQKHTVTVNTQVRGGLNRVVALQEAVQFTGDLGKHFGEEPSIDNVLAVADQFFAWLEGDGEGNAAGEQQSSGGE